MVDNCSVQIGRDYPFPIVDHEHEARIAKQKISNVRKNELFKYESRLVFEKHGSRKSRSKRKLNTNQKSKVSIDNKQLKLF